MGTTTWGPVMASEALVYMASASSARAHDHHLPAGLDHLDLVISSSSLHAHLCLNLCKWRWKKYSENYTVLLFSPKPSTLRRAWTSLCHRDLPTISTVPWKRSGLSARATQEELRSYDAGDGGSCIKIRADNKSQSSPSSKCYRHLP